MKTVLLKNYHPAGRTTLAHPDSVPGPVSDTVTITAIHNVPDSVTPAKLCLLWSRTVDVTWLGSREPMKGGRFEFDYSELGEGRIIR